MRKFCSLGGAGYRSRYLSHAKRALYHLSYAPWLTVSSHNSWYNFKLHQSLSLRMWPVHEGVVLNCWDCTETMLSIVSSGRVQASVLCPDLACDWRDIYNISNVTWNINSYLWINCLVAEKILILGKRQKKMKYVYSNPQGSKSIKILVQGVELSGSALASLNSFQRRCQPSLIKDKKEGSSGIWTRDLSHPKRESYP